MNLMKIFGERQPAESRLRREFPLVITRLSGEAEMNFDAQVTGYFVGRNGKPDFVTERIAIRGIPQLNIKDMLPDEIKQVKRYALSVEYPRLLTRKI